MKLRIISDLHIDVNNKQPLEYNDDTFTIIAGDISGSPKKSIKWLNNNIKNGLFVAGNHLCYNKERKGLNYHKDLLRAKFPIESSVSFLENEYKIIDDKVFMGCTLYTDYKYPCPPYYYTQQDNIRKSLGGINDFKWGHYSENGKLIGLHPTHYISEFNRSVEYLENILEQYKDKQCIIITHYAPSEMSIDSKYQGDNLNASYISNLESFVLEHKNISHWIHGHVHCSLDYELGNTRVICNARGYIHCGDNYKFDKDLIVEI